MSTLWHYLVGKSFHETWREGLLRASPDAELLRRQGVTNPPDGYFDCRPVAWFSSADRWEPSFSVKVRRPDGTIEYAVGLEENARAGGGLWRIGVAPETAPVTWTDYRKGGFDRPEVVNRVAKAAQALGADTRNWRASEGHVPRERWIAIEVWRDGAWTPWTPPTRATLTLGGI